MALARLVHIFDGNLCSWGSSWKGRKERGSGSFERHAGQLARRQHRCVEVGVCHDVQKSVKGWVLRRASFRPCRLEWAVVLSRSAVT